MSVQIEIPTLGESISTVTVAQWLKNDGDFVEKDEAIVELETDKVNQELNSPEAGILRIGAKPGDEIEIGGVIGQIDPSGAPAIRKTEEAPKAVEPMPNGDATAEEKDEHAHKATPVARRVAAEYGVSLDAVAGHGIGGKITKDDVLAFVERGKDEKEAAPKAPPPAPAPAAKKEAAPAPKPPVGERAVTRKKLSQLRRRIAARLVEAQHSAAMLTTFNEADMSAVMDLRARFKEPFREKYGIGLGFMSFFVKAAVEALNEFPAINSYLEGDEQIEHHYCDIGVAVGSERGLVVPVIRNAEKLSFAQIEQAIRDFSVRAKDGKLTLDELSGGTFSISNGGVYGSMMSTPILNPPQSGILGMHNIIKRPVAVGDDVKIRPMMYLALSYDHRIVDGKEAVGFLVRVKECIESPERMLLEI